MLFSGGTAGTKGKVFLNLKNIFLIYLKELLQKNLKKNVNPIKKKNMR